MNIVRRIVNGFELVGVFVEDAGYQYPIFIESLHSKGIFDELVKSGYDFCGVPYDFRKDGKGLDTLESVGRETIQGSEEQEMYDLLESQKYTSEELRERIVASKVNFIKLPDGDYTVNTREEFLKLLDAFNPLDVQAPFLPINYYVAPEARFTMDELFAPDNKKYLDKINSYRKLSYGRFKRFLNWSGQDFKTNTEILKFWYGWGIDGLSLDFINIYETTIRMPEDAMYTEETAEHVLFSKREIAVFDKNGNSIVREDASKNMWKPEQSVSVLEDICKDLELDEVTPGYVRTNIMDTMIVMDMLSGSVHITTDSLKVSVFSLDNLQVYVNGLSGAPCNPDLWPLSKHKELYEASYMRAIASDALRSRISESSASSIRALMLSGLNKKGAILNIAAKYEDSDNKKLSELVTWDAVNAYAKGLPVSDEAKEIIDEIIEGNYNVDNIESVFKSLSAIDSRSVYIQIYALHKVLEVSLDEIQEKIKNMGEEDYIVFESKGYKMKFKLPINEARHDAFKYDLQGYRKKAADTAINYVYITQVVRELGTASADRHVGFRGYSISSSKLTTKTMLSYFMDNYKAKVKEKLIDSAILDTALDNAKVFGIRCLFSSALNGQIEYPAYLDSEIVTVPEDISRSCKGLLTEVYENLEVACNCNGMTPGSFLFFFVNAYLTSTQVIPLKNTTIEQIDFIAAWTDFRQNTATFQKLVEKDAIPVDHMPWSEVACSANYQLVTHSQINDTDLYYYQIQAEKYRENFSKNAYFKSVPHPTEYLNPGFYEDYLEEEETENQLREGAPRFDVNARKKLSWEDYDELFDTANNINKEFGVFRPFYGFEAEDFYYCENVLEKEVHLGRMPIYINLPDRIKVGRGEFENYMELEKYVNDPDVSVINLYGREYIFRDFSGAYWRVTI